MNASSRSPLSSSDFSLVPSFSFARPQVLTLRYSTKFLPLLGLLSSPYLAFYPNEECHIGERIVREDGTLEYLKTFRLSAAQVRRAYQLGPRFR